MSAWDALKYKNYQTPNNRDDSRNFISNSNQTQATNDTKPASTNTSNTASNASSQTPTRSYSGSYMGNTNAMTDALARNNISMVNGGQKAAVSINKPKDVEDFDYKGYYASLVNGIGGGGGIGKVNAFTPSDSYTQAMNYTSQLLDKLSSGRTAYTDKIGEMMDSIANRASFAYDPDTDPLFQNYLNNAMASGKTAMQDTMGQASALTGGYGSTYATAAANGAYNNFIQDAYNNLPEYYETALNAYQNETNNLYNKLGMYQTADEAEYSRLANAYANNFDYANDMYGKEYNNYWQTTNANQEAAQYNADLAYKYANLAQDNAKYMAELKYQQDKDKQSALAQTSSSSDASGGYTETPSKSDYSKLMTDARAAYEQKGDAGLKDYMESLYPYYSDETYQQIREYAEQGTSPKRTFDEELFNQKYRRN